MHAVIRAYSGPAAKKVVDLLESRKDEIEGLMRSVTGFVSYSLLRTSDGGASVTVCADKVGADESVRIAREWLRKNTHDMNVNPPVIREGPVILHLR
jgi:hypothetical protein